MDLDRIEEITSAMLGALLAEQDFPDPECDDSCIRERFVVLGRSDQHDAVFGKGSQQSHFQSGLFFDACENAVLSCCDNIVGDNESERRRNARGLCAFWGRKSERS